MNRLVLLNRTTFLNPTIERRNWAWEIKAESSWFQWKLNHIWNYRHLLFRLVRRDLLIHHQQTVLGPLWIVFQPLIILLIYVLIFEKAVGLSTDGVSPTLFYLSGIILWTLFSECFTGTAFTFIQNATLFAKVYFPRLIIPLSVILLNFTRFAIQFTLFFILLLIIDYDSVVDHPLRWISALVLSTITIAGIGLGMGLIFSILTAKYRDLVNLIHLIVRLLMFATPVIYPLSLVGNDVRKWININPLTSMFELFRFGFLGQGTFSQIHLLYSVAAMFVLVFVGSMLFSKFSNKLQDVI
jgi:lipopolysaccharide transport system permease protein